ncbi:hypothetical protein [Cytobacillus purgationiresistens]|uniref:Uncharacterized protein n=1 Tax=Cytobacillus purgationiresistens TaxID=863449 RepID=A0ABU0ALE9_9BACI|nr:hypothetical protein [Cytobacillus purgationiresistens]MDQ0271218.1 hypothetical protein [Cytobacillus purgationiresistens]
MVNPLSKVFSFFILIGCLFIVPLFFSFIKADDLAEINAQNVVTKFVDSVRNKGYISPSMYNDFVYDLESTGYLFDIELSHEKKTFHPVYEDPADSGTFKGDYIVDYDNYYSKQINKVLFPDNSLPIESESRVYKLMVGDYFKVTVQNMNRTKATIVHDFLTFGNTGNPTVIHIPYGGMVHNEDY